MQSQPRSRPLRHRPQQPYQCEDRGGRPEQCRQGQKKNDPKRRTEQSALSGSSRREDDKRQEEHYAAHSTGHSRTDQPDCLFSFRQRSRQIVPFAFKCPSILSSPASFNSLRISRPFSEADVGGSSISSLYSLVAQFSRRSPGSKNRTSRLVREKRLRNDELSLRPLGRLRQFHFCADLRNKKGLKPERRHREGEDALPTY